MRRTPVLLCVALAFSSLGMATGNAAAVSPCAAFDAVSRRADPVLGAGLTLTVANDANYAAFGSGPVVTLGVSSPVPDATVTYSVSTRGRVLLLGSVHPLATVSLALPKTVPGAYQVEARLVRAGRETGSACLRYGVGMPGAALDVAALPTGKDWGGGSAERQVALDRALGMGVARMQVTVADFLTDPASYDKTWEAAARRAKAAGIKLVVQVGQGAPAESAAVRHGTWEGIVRQIVARQHGVVDFWEAWNEPNRPRFYDGSPADYVRSVLTPFARAVHAADRGAQVVGGSAYGADPSWWTGFGRAGGFRAVDVVAVHAYSWARSYEQSGMVQDLSRLIALKASFGAAAKPLWDTESGYTSTTEMGGPWAQADNIARKLLWEKSLRVVTQNYQLEGGWGDWSVVDYFRGVKPAAMAMLTQGTLLRGRTFRGWVTTPVSEVYAARFANSRGEAITAVWTDGSPVRLPLKRGHNVVDETGAPSTVSSAMTVRSAVQYVRSVKGQAAL